MSLAQAMAHPWVTLEGAWPLTPHAQLLVRAAAAAGSADGANGGTNGIGGGAAGGSADGLDLPPTTLEQAATAAAEAEEGEGPWRASTLQAMVVPGLELRTYAAGELLMRQGQKGEAAGRTASFSQLGALPAAAGPVIGHEQGLRMSTSLP